MKTIRNLEQLRAEQLRHEVKRARLETQLHYQWKALHQRPAGLFGLLEHALPLVAGLLRKRKSHWFDIFR